MSPHVARTRGAGRPGRAATWTARAVAGVVLVASAALAGCSGEPGCSGGFALDLPADVEGAPDPQGALDAWLASDDPPSLGGPPDGAPTSGWTEEPGAGADSVALVHGDWRVTAWRTPGGEWVVTSLECT